MYIIEALRNKRAQLFKNLYNLEKEFCLKLVFDQKEEQKVSMATELEGLATKKSFYLRLP